MLTPPPSSRYVKDENSKPSGATEVGRASGGVPPLRPLGEIQGANETTTPAQIKRRCEGSGCLSVRPRWKSAVLCSKKADPISFSQRERSDSLVVLNKVDLPTLRGTPVTSQR